MEDKKYPINEIIHTITLTEEEQAEALIQAKIKKYFREKHKQYWQELEKIKPTSNEQE